MQFYKDFLMCWGYTPHKVSTRVLERVETNLQFKFPKIYFDCVNKIGIFGTTLNLLSQIVEQNIAIHDLSEMIHPNKIAATMKGWQEAGMPEGLIPIGNDCGGNLFCFDLDDGMPARLDEAPIYFFDHDFDEINLESKSFEEWISSFNSIESLKSN
jgi:SMI1 / KNR4 family (SUKH-1)